jgi:hypothetical protein
VYGGCASVFALVCEAGGFGVREQDGVVESETRRRAESLEMHEGAEVGDRWVQGVGFGKVPMLWLADDQVL